MYTTDINVLAPKTTKTVFNTKALLEALFPHTEGLVPGKGIWVYTNKRKANDIYGPHFVNVTIGTRVIRIKNSYDGTCPLEVDFGDGAKRYPKTATIEEVVSDILGYQPTFNSTFLTMDEQMKLVQAAGSVRWHNFTEEMAAEIVDTDFNVEQLKDTVLMMVLGGYKFEGRKRFKPITDPIVEWRLYQAITAIFANVPNNTTVSEEVVIPPKPNKYIYGDAGPRRPNPEYARWMELYSDLVEA